MTEQQEAAMEQALEALEETRNALAWFYDSYPQDVTPKGNELLPRVETVLTALRQALADNALDKMAENAREIGLDYEPVWDNLPSNKDVEDALRAKRVSQLTAALEQPAQQEPVAWSYWQSCLNDDGTQTAPWVHRLSKFQPSESIINKDITPLYTIPPQRKPLTDEQLGAVIRAIPAKEFGVFAVARAIEAAHGIKEKK